MARHKCGSRMILTLGRPIVHVAAGIENIPRNVVPGNLTTTALRVLKAPTQNARIDGHSRDRQVRLCQCNLEGKAGCQPRGQASANMIMQCSDRESPLQHLIEVPRPDMKLQTPV